MPPHYPLLVLLVLLGATATRATLLLLTNRGMQPVNLTLNIPTSAPYVAAFDFTVPPGVRCTDLQLYAPLVVAPDASASTPGNVSFWLWASAPDGPGVLASATFRATVAGPEPSGWPTTTSIRNGTFHFRVPYSVALDSGTHWLAMSIAQPLPLRWVVSSAPARTDGGATYMMLLDPAAENWTSAGVAEALFMPAGVRSASQQLATALLATCVTASAATTPTPTLAPIPSSATPPTPTPTSATDAPAPTVDGAVATPTGPVEPSVAEKWTIGVLIGVGAVLVVTGAIAWVTLRFCSNRRLLRAIDREELLAWNRENNLTHSDAEAVELDDMPAAPAAAAVTGAHRARATDTAAELAAGYEQRVMQAIPLDTARPSSAPTAPHHRRRQSESSVPVKK